MSNPNTSQTTDPPIDAADEFYAGVWWRWSTLGLGLRPASGSECAAEIQRLRSAIDAAIGEFDRGKPMSAFSFLLNAKEGLS